MTDKFNRIADYFQQKTTGRHRTLEPDHYDSQFNQIVDYLNDVLKETIDGLSDGGVQGINDKAGALLRSIGDGTANWDLISGDSLDDYSIKFQNLVRSNSGSILISREDGEVSALTPNESDLLLFSGGDNAPEWRKIQADDFEENSISGEKLTNLSMDNFLENNFTINIANNSIENRNIKDLNVTNEKIVDNAVSKDQLGVFNNLTAMTAGRATSLNGYNIERGALTIDKFADGSITLDVNNALYKKTWTIRAYENVNDPARDSWQKYIRDNKPYGILSYHAVANNTITDNDMIPVKTNPADYTTTNYAQSFDTAKTLLGESYLNDKAFINADGTFGGYAWNNTGSIYFQLPLANDSVTLDMFDEEVRNAFNALPN